MYLKGKSHYEYNMIFSIEVWLIYSVVLVSGVQQNDSDKYIYIYVFVYRLFSHIGYYRILSRVPCAIQ